MLYGERHVELCRHEIENHRAEEILIDIVREKKMWHYFSPFCGRQNWGTLNHKENLLLTVLSARITSNRVCRNYLAHSSNFMLGGFATKYKKCVETTRNENIAQPLSHWPMSVLDFCAG